MRLTCPNCSATYEIETGLISGGGSHVQCSACHTRWFEREPEQPPQLSEDEIITRLDTRPRLAAVASAPPDPEPVEIRPEAPPAPPPPEPIETEPATVVTPLRRRPASERPAPAAPKPAPPVQQRNRFGLGFAAAIVLAGAGIGLYLGAADLGERLPVGAAALDGYVARVDVERERIEARLGALRDQALNTVFPEG